MRRPALATLVALSLLWGCDGTPRDELAISRAAADWRPMLLHEVGPLDPGAPPAIGSAVEAADLAGVKAWWRPKTADEQAAIARWGEQDPASAWAEEARLLAGSHDVNEPARAARALAHVQAAIYDATVATWSFKRRYGRRGPQFFRPGATPVPGLPSYPSEDAAVAQAASEVLGNLFPQAARGLAAKARAVAQVPVAMGRAFPSDVAAGQFVGHHVARVAIARLAEDQRLEGRAPTAGGYRDPWALAPEAGGWQPWTFTMPAMVASSPPGPPLPAEVQAAVARNRAMTIKMRAIAVKWLELDQARVWHARAQTLVARARPSAPEAARVLAYTDLALADAAIGAWFAEYAVGRPRPPALAKGIEPVVPPPSHPAWPSDVAAMATAAATYLAEAFPAEAERLQADAAEAADAPVFAGWCLESDREAGVRMGEEVGRRVVMRARMDGRP